MVYYSTIGQLLCIDEILVLGHLNEMAPSPDLNIYDNHLTPHLLDTPVTSTK